MHVRARGGSSGLRGVFSWFGVFWGGDCGCFFAIMVGEVSFFNSSLLSALFVASVCFCPFSYYRVEC